MKGIYNISIPQEYVISQPDIDGSEKNIKFNKHLDKYCNNIVRRGWKIIEDPTGKNIKAELKSLSIEEFLTIKDFSGTVEHFNPFIKIAENDIDNEITIGINNRIYEDLIDDKDPDNLIYKTKVHTWRNWRDINHPLGKPINGYYYFMSASFGKAISDDDLLLINDNISFVEEIPINVLPKKNLMQRIFKPVQTFIKKIFN